MNTYILLTRNKATYYTAEEFLLKSSNHQNVSSFLLTVVVFTKSILITYMLHFIFNNGKLFFSQKKNFKILIENTVKPHWYNILSMTSHFQHHPSSALRIFKNCIREIDESLNCKLTQFHKLRGSWTVANIQTFLDNCT